MDIKSIQPSRILTEALRSPDGSNAKAEALRECSPGSLTRVRLGSSASINAIQTFVVQAQKLISHIDYVKDQLDKILVDFPPFFPVGTYQRVDLIKGVRNIQDEVQKASFLSEIKKDISSRKLTENATDHDISAALDKLFSLRDEIAQNIVEATESIEPGTVVSISV